MAAEGDTAVIRVVVTGDPRDRIAEMADDELDYAGHQLAEHHRWDQLRVEQPLLHGGPQDAQRVRDLRTKMGDPVLRDAPHLLAACLRERFGGDIALGSGPVTVSAATDIALGKDGER